MFLKLIADYIVVADYRQRLQAASCSVASQ